MVDQTVFMQRRRDLRGRCTLRNGDIDLGVRFVQRRKIENARNDRIGGTAAQRQHHDERDDRAHKAVSLLFRLLVLRHIRFFRLCCFLDFLFRLFDIRFAAFFGTRFFQQFFKVTAHAFHAPCFLHFRSVFFSKNDPSPKAPPHGQICRAAGSVGCPHCSRCR